MLVLTRKSGEELVVPQHRIVLKILEIRGNAVRVGITAPPDVQLYRREIWERLRGQFIVKEGSALEGEAQGEPGETA
jgi:carbon storage regulator